jgi:hypothetical protein
MPRPPPGGTVCRGMYLSPFPIYFANEGLWARPLLMIWLLDPEIMPVGNARGGHHRSRMFAHMDKVLQ